MANKAEGEEQRKPRGVQFSKEVLVTQFDSDTNLLSSRVPNEGTVPNVETVPKPVPKPVPNNVPKGPKEPEAGTKRRNSTTLTFKRGSITTSDQLLKMLATAGGFGEDYEKLTSHKAGKVLGMLQDDTTGTQQPDTMKQLKSAHLFLLSNNKKAAWEEEDNPSEEYLEEKERARLLKLKRDRGPCFTRSFGVIFHLSVLLNFFMAWIDSCKIIIEEAKFQILLLQNEYDCLEIIETADWLDHSVNIFHALMSSCVLFADNRHNGPLCIAYVFTQAIHTSFKSFEFFMKLRFENEGPLIPLSFFLIFNVLLDVVTSIVVIQRYYDLTDRVRTRAKHFAATQSDGKSMNDDIIYQNQSTFLQRKHILREAIASQVYTVILKIDNYRLKGLEADHLALYRELHAAKAALEDVDGVDNQVLLKELRKANAQRLKMFDTDPSLLQTKSGLLNGSLSMHKLFRVNFGDR